MRNFLGLLLFCAALPLGAQDGAGQEPEQIEKIEVAESAAPSPAAFLYSVGPAFWHQDPRSLWGFSGRARWLRGRWSVAAVGLLAESQRQTEGEIGYARGAQKLRFGFRESDLPLYFGPAGDAVEREGFMAYEYISQPYSRLDGRLGVKITEPDHGWQELSLFTRQTLVGERARFGITYEHIGAQDARRFVRSGRPKGLIPPIYGETQRRLTGFADVVLREGADWQLAANAHLEFQMSHPDFEQRAPSREDFMLGLSFVAPKEPFRTERPRSAEADWVDQQAATLYGVRFNQLALWPGATQKGELKAYTPVIGYFAVSDFYSLRLELGVNASLSESGALGYNLEKNFFWANELAAQVTRQLRFELESGFHKGGLQQFSGLETNDKPYQRYLAFFLGALHLDLWRYPNTRLQLGYAAWPKGMLLARVGRDVALGKTGATIGFGAEAAFSNSGRPELSGSRASVQGRIGRFAGLDVWLKAQRNSYWQHSATLSDDVIELYLVRKSY